MVPRQRRGIGRNRGRFISDLNYSLLVSGDIILVKRYTLAEARKKLNRKPPKKAMSVNLAKLGFGVVLPALAVLGHSSGGRSIARIALDAVGGNPDGIDNIPEVAVDAIKKKWPIIVGGPVGTAIAGKFLGKYAPKASVPGVVSVKAF